MNKKFLDSEFNFEGKRLDKFLAEMFKDFSRSKLQGFVKDGFVLVNTQRVKPSYVLASNDVVFVKAFETPSSDLCEEELKLPVLYEDEDCLVLEKAPGLVVHPGAGDTELGGTLVNQLHKYVESDVGSSLRPGIVHRLDKDTSGLIVVARTHKGYNDLVSQFSDRKVGKSYFALVVGQFDTDEGIIEAPIGRSLKDRKKMAVVPERQGKPALSSYKVLATYNCELGAVSLLEVEIKTGRTHQIRVHMSSIGHPLLGDAAYGLRKWNQYFAKEFGLERQFLHAAKLKFTPPSTGKQVALKSELPEDLSKVLNCLEN